MNNYIIKGRVLPIRAQLSFGPINMSLESLNGESLGAAEFTIYCNEITIYYDTEKLIDIYDLRNQCLNLSGLIVAQIGYFLGFGYNTEINQILCKEQDINYVFGVDIPCLAVRNKDKNINDFMSKIMSFKGNEVRFIQRCFVDLQLAITHPIDTPFYCYRAIESLRQFCRDRYNIKKESEQWQKLSDITNFSWEHTKSIKEFANHARHGDHRNFNAEQRQEFFTNTWDFVDAFIESEYKNNPL